MFKIEEAFYYTTTGDKKKGYQILKNDMPMFTINKFLEIKGSRSAGTSKQYAYKLKRYLEYLNDVKNKNYKQAKHKDVMKFIDSIMFESEGLLQIDTGKASYSTIRAYLTVIQEFYKYLEDECMIDTDMNWIEKKEQATYSNRYGQIWTIDTKSFLNNRIERFKSSKEYIKWYTDEEREVILNNFYTLRDKAIFLLSLEGLRNEEIITLRTEDIKVDYENQCYEVHIYASKGKETGNVNSVVPITNDIGEVIDKYINSERDVIISKKIEEDEDYIYPDELFINLQGVNAGKPISYNNCLHILKRAAKRGGLNPDVIKTHSGRSTKTMEYLHYMEENPDSGFTYEHLRQLMRWKHISSSKLYVNTKDKKVALSVAKKIAKSKAKKEV